MKRVEKVRRVRCPKCDAGPGLPCHDTGRNRDANHQARIKLHQRAFPPIPRGLAPAGTLSQFDSVCAVCHQPIQRHVHQVVPRKAEWIHTTCAPGQDDV